jgi:histone deacetylase 1/2
VLYVDIDVHHGDGVETAFLDSNQVMTVSFHQRTKKFFSEERGYVSQVGEGAGQYRALNVSFMEGMGDEGYCEMFKTIMERVVEVF